MTETTGPVEMLAVSFGPSTQFQGRIADEIDKLEQAGHIRCSCSESETAARSCGSTTTARVS
jgi:hypothetical protein